MGRTWPIDVLEYLRLMALGLPCTARALIGSGRVGVSEHGNLVAILQMLDSPIINDHRPRLVASR